MLRAVLILAAALAAASSVWAQAPDYPRRPLPLDRKPVERVGTTDQSQVQAPQQSPAKSRPANMADARPL
jgi:hypothetical protein